MMRVLFNKKAFTLLETLLAIMIIAAIALPLMSLFLQSIKTDQAAKGVLNANYISQEYIETLDTMTYYQALSNLPDHKQTGDYYLSATIEPYGTASSLFSGKCGYVHLVFYDDGSMLAVMPDGEDEYYTSAPNTISLSINGGKYTFSCDGAALPVGDIPYGYCAMIVNAMKKPQGTSTKTNITLGASCKALLYCQESGDDDFTFTGTYYTYEIMMSGEESLVHVTTYVYDSATATDAIAEAESYINIKNW